MFACEWHSIIILEINGYFAIFKLCLWKNAVFFAAINQILNIILNNIVTILNTKVYMI